MRTVGSFLILMSVAALAVGVITAALLYSSAQNVVENIIRGREIVDISINNVSGVFNDFDKVYLRARDVVRDYERGLIEDISDDRVGEVFEDINTLLTKSNVLKQELDLNIDDLAVLKEGVEREVQGLTGMAMVSFGGLVGSGWLFGFGVLFRSASKRRDVQ